MSDKTISKNKGRKTASNKLCESCRRTCKQSTNAVVASCPRYYPFKRSKSRPYIEWKQMELI